MKCRACRKKNAVPGNALCPECKKKIMKADRRAMWGTLSDLAAQRRDANYALRRIARGDFDRYERS
jgi:hypothetical protein